MASPSKSQPLTIAYVFSVSLALLIVVYLLRGFGILTQLPGGLIIVLLFSTFGTGLMYLVQKTKRY